MTELHVVTDHSYAPLFRDWLWQRLGIQLGDDARYVASVLREGSSFEIVACAAFNRWTEGACEAHVATDGTKRQKVNREFIWTCFDFAFNFAGKNCIVTHAAPENLKSIQLHEQLGLHEVGFINGYYGEGRNARVFSINKQEWQEGPWASLEAQKKD